MKSFQSFNNNRQWNINLGYVDQLNARRNEKALASYEGNIYAWVSANMEIITSLAGYIPDDALGNLEKLAKQIRSSLQNQISNTNTNLSSAQRYSLFFNVREELYNLDKEITKTLFKFKLLKLKKHNVTTEEHLEADYNH